MDHGNYEAEVPSHFELKSRIAEWYLLHIYGRIPGFNGKGNKFIEQFKKRKKQGFYFLGILFIVNAVYSLIPWMHIGIFNFLHLSILIGVPGTLIWYFIMRKKDKAEEDNVFYPPLPEENGISLYYMDNNAIYVNYYNHSQYWFQLNWSDVTYIEIIPTQLYLGDQMDKVRSKDRNKVMIQYLDKRFAFVEEQYKDYPFAKQLLHNDMISLKIVTNNNINILPIPPLWIEEGFVEDMLVYIDGCVGERFFIQPEDEEQIKSIFPDFYKYIRNVKYAERKKYFDQGQSKGYSMDEIKQEIKSFYHDKIKSRIKR